MNEPQPVRRVCFGSAVQVIGLKNFSKRECRTVSREKDFLLTISPRAIVVYYPRVFLVSVLCGDVLRGGGGLGEASGIGVSTFLVSVIFYFL